MALGDLTDNVAALVGSSCLSNPTTASPAATQDRTTALTAGTYRLHCTEDCYFLQGGVAVAATTSSIPLDAGYFPDPIVVTGAANAYISAIRKSIDGTLSCIKIG